MREKLWYYDYVDKPWACAISYFLSSFPFPLGISCCPDCFSSVLCWQACWNKAVICSTPKKIAASSGFTPFLATSQVLQLHWHVNDIHKRAGNTISRYCKLNGRGIFILCTPHALTVHSDPGKMIFRVTQPLWTNSGVSQGVAVKTRKVATGKMILSSLFCKWTPLMDQGREAIIPLCGYLGGDPQNHLASDWKGLLEVWETWQFHIYHYQHVLLCMA